MIKINLVPQNIIIEEKKRDIEIIVTKVGILVSSIFLLLYLIRFVAYKNVQFKLNTLDKELKKLEPIVLQVRSIEEAKKSLQTRMSIIEGLIKNSLVYPLFLDDFVSCIPNDLWINNVNTDIINGECLINISAMAYNNYAIADFIDNLQKHGDFKEVEVSFIKTNLVDNEVVLQFEVLCKYIIQV